MHRFGSHCERVVQRERAEISRHGLAIRRGRSGSPSGRARRRPGARGCADAGVSFVCMDRLRRGQWLGGDAASVSTPSPSRFHSAINALEHAMVMGAGEVEGGCASTLGGRGAALVDSIDESGRSIRWVAHDLSLIHI